MECINKDKPCPFRRLVNDGDKMWLNCEWECEYNLPLPDRVCQLKADLGFCPFQCIYEALETEDCPFKSELQEKLGETRR